MNEIPKIDVEKTKNNITEFVQNKVSEANADGLVVGLSGGIDSTVAAFLACEAVGKENVFGVVLPSTTTPTEDKLHGTTIAQLLGINYKEMAIDSILNEFDKSEHFTIKYSNDSEKIRVYYGKIKLFETGEGSINNVSSTEQELATCLIWNKYIELKSQHLDFTIDIVNDIIKDISPNFTSNWVKSLAEQVNAIEVLLKKYGIPETDLANYKLCLYGSTIDDDNLHVGELYKKLITKYSKFFKGNKHHFDPSDIILYNKNLDIDSFKELANDNITDGTQTKKLFMDNFFSTRDIMGISLKQITTTPKIEEYNINSE